MCDIKEIPLNIEIHEKISTHRKVKRNLEYIKTTQGIKLQNTL